MNDQIEYTDLFVLDGEANQTTGSIVQYWMAINTIANKRISVTTYDGEVRAFEIFDLKLGWNDKKYTRVVSNNLPLCFGHKLSELIISPTQPQLSPIIDLTHPIVTSLDFDDIEQLTCSRKFGKLINNINNIALLKYPYDKDAFNKCKGDIFEVFVEFLIKYQGRDPNIGITDYAVQQAIDFGVDGVGKSTRNSKPITVQVKYRQYNHIIHWNNDHIANFYNQSRGDYFDPIGFIPKDGVNMLIVTSAHEVHYTVGQFSYNQIRYICYDGLVQLTEHMTTFWDDFARALKVKKPNIKELKKSYELREHQLDAVSEIISVINTNPKDSQLVIELPTGTGKTLIQAEAIRRCWVEKGFSCALIMSPTILLTYQHLTEIASHLMANGIDVECLNVSSGEFDDEQIRREKEIRGMEVNYINSTTDINIINEKYFSAKAKNKLLVISATYQSAEKIWRAGKEAQEQWRPDIQMNDEAHFISTENGYYLGTPNE